MEKDLLGAIKFLKTDFPSAIWSDKTWATVYGPDDWSQVRLEMGGYRGLAAIIIDKDGNDFDLKSIWIELFWFKTNLF